jgi:hypothetical protein
MSSRYRPLVLRAIRERKIDRVAYLVHPFLLLVAGSVLGAEAS